jgi:hypothetical protein
MTLPDEKREQIRAHLWTLAEELRWSDLSDVERARYYEAWTREPSIGGTLGHYMDPRKVRVYIKDSLLKPYERARLADTGELVMRRLSIPATEAIAEEFIKPHGRRLADGRIICWSKSRDWKLTLMAAFERAHLRRNARPFGVVLLETGKTADNATRTLVQDAAQRLSIEHLEWID